MPYIKDARRFYLESNLPAPQDAGELNFVITLLCLEFLNRKSEKYQTYNDIIGVLECSKLEMYRRAVAPYEDTKIQENGDVYFQY